MKKFYESNCRRFNSTLVRLKGIAGKPDAIVVYRFNSTLVRLKEESDDTDDNFNQRFNSTLVRLKEYVILNSRGEHNVSILH